MNSFAQAFKAGFSADQIINFLSNSYPDLKPRIQAARKIGYSPQKIVSFLSNLFGADVLHGGTEAGQEMLSGEQASQKIKDIAEAGLAVGGAIGLGKVLPKAKTAIQGLLGGASQGPAPTSGSPPPGAPSSPIGPHPMGNAPVPSPSVNAPVPTVPPVPPVSPELQKATEFLQNLEAENLVKEMAATGKTPQEIAAEVQTKMHPSTRKSYLGKRTRGEERPIEEHIKNYLKTPEGLLREDVVKFGKPEKGSLVSTPTGIVGDVKDIKDKEALVESDGKLHKVKSDELISSPLPEKDLADLYEDLIKGVEKSTEEEVSRNVNWAGYDPKTNTLAYLPHLGGLYTYENIDPEDAKLLTSVLNTRKTSGENFIGVWKAGTKSPIGAAMSKLIQKLQKEAGGKGKEYSHKFETLYNALEPAMKASKNKKKKK